MMTPLASRVTVPAETRDLVTLADVREQLQIKANDTAHDAWLSKVITRASAQAERYCNRVFAVQEYLDAYGSLSGAAGAPLMLGQAPVIEIMALTIDKAALASTGYVVDQAPGHLYQTGSASGWTATNSIAVDYTAGFDIVPFDVQQAVIELCVMEFRGRGRDPMLRERDTPGLGREAFWVGPPPGGATSLPGDIAALLDPYRRGMIG